MYFGVFCVFLSSLSRALMLLRYVCFVLSGLVGVHTWTGALEPAAPDLSLLFSIFENFRWLRLRPAEVVTLDIAPVFAPLGCHGRHTPCGRLQRLRIIRMVLKAATE